MPTNLANQVASRVSSFRAVVDAAIPRWLQMETPEEFRAMELGLSAMSRQLSDEVAGDVLGERLACPVFQAQTWAAADNGGRFRSGGPRSVEVCLLGGGRRSYRVPYLKPDRRGLPGRPRRSGRRGKSGVGLYPTLAALGIANGVTPALAGEICRQVTDSDSVRSGREALARRGIDLGHKQTLRIVGKVGRRAVEQRDQWLQEWLERDPTDTGPLAGKRVFISTDGGRCRMRIPAKSGRRRAKSRHRGYQAPWQEPKMLVIYVLDDDGNIDESFRPVYDGTMGDCDQLFKMLLGYLKALGAVQAAELTVVADGAKWIWDRIDDLATGLGIPRSRVTEVLDWYHAVQTLHTIAAIPAQWSKRRRAKWVTQAKKHLGAGRIGSLVEHIQQLAVGRRAKRVLAHVGYFTRNATRMQYATFRARSIPRGSGAMESMVRRVVNLRMKSNAKFWLLASAEAMLLMRSYLNAGRFDDLIDWTMSKAVPWWCPQPAELISDHPFKRRKAPPCNEFRPLTKQLGRRAA